MTRRKPIEEIATYLSAWVITGADDWTIERHSPEELIDEIPEEILSAALRAGGHRATWVELADLRATMIRCAEIEYQSILRTTDPMRAAVELFGQPALGMVAARIEAREGTALEETMRAIEAHTLQGSRVTSGAAAAARIALDDRTTRAMLSRMVVGDLATLH